MSGTDSLSAGRATALVGPRRTRLAAQARRTQILDETSKLVIGEGLSAVSMEAVGRICRISKALVYNYFPSRERLLAALLMREQNALRDRGMETALQATSFPDLIRQTTRLYLEHTRERGPLIQALLSDPSVARLMEEENQSERDRRCCQSNGNSSPSRRSEPKPSRGYPMTARHSASAAERLSL